MFDLSNLGPKLGDSFTPDPSLGAIYKTPVFGSAQNVQPMQQTMETHMKGNFINQSQRSFNVLTTMDNRKLGARLKTMFKDEGNYSVSLDEKETKKILGKDMFHLLWNFNDKEFVVCGHKIFREGDKVHIERDE